MRLRWHSGVLMVALGGFLLAASPPAVAAPAAPPAELFAQLPAISGVRISPSGRHAAMVLRAPGQPAVAAVVDLSAPSAIKVVGGFPKAEVQSVGWVNEGRLHFMAVASRGFIEEGDAGVFAVDRDGSNMQQLIDARWRNDETASRIGSRILTYEWSVVDSVGDGSPDVFVARGLRDNDNDLVPVQLARLNTLDGRLTRIGHAMPEGAQGWLFDGKGEPRVAVVPRDGRTRMFWRAPGSEAWTLLEDVPWLGDDGFGPVALEADGTLIVAATRGGDTRALHAYDPRKRAFDPEPLVALKGFDVGGDLLGDGGAPVVFDGTTRRVVGARLDADRPMTVWFDERLSRIQQVVDRSLPAGRFNRLSCANCESARFLVVHSSSDRQPGEWYVYDHEKSQLVRLGAVRRGFDESTQGRRTFHRVAARDGLSLPVVVTHPAGASDQDPRPAVVLVHGGPWVRGSTLRWEPEAQFLASRGWRVLQVEFRGSTGFGQRHLRAGWKQWGQAMQDDLADAVAWAAREKLVDPQRVCIAGASYGGYAALMGPVRHPEVYRCAASHVGVTDLMMMYTSRWSDMSDQWLKFGMPMVLGDPKADAEMLRRHSPVYRVSDIKVPVLLAQGGKDRRVPKEHADAFERAARSAGVNVERVDYPEEGHGFFFAENRADWLRRLEAFLAKSLGAPR